MKTRQEIEASLNNCRALRLIAKETLKATNYGTTSRLVAQLDDAIWLGRIEAYKDVLGLTTEEMG